MMKLALASMLGLLINLAPAQAASDMRTEDVVLPASGSTSLKGKIKGGQTVRYVLRVPAPGEYAVALKTGNTSAYVNISQAGKDEALHVGSMAGNSFKGRLPEAGDYTLTVYLMRSAARRGATASYTLQVARER